MSGCRVFYPFSLLHGRCMRLLQLLRWGWVWSENPEMGLICVAMNQKRREMRKWTRESYLRLKTAPIRVFPCNG